MGKAEDIILFDLIVTILLLAYGTATNSGSSITTLSILPQPPISTLPSINCTGLCSPFSSIISATAYIGWAIVNIPVLFGYIIVQTVTLANILLSIVFSPTFDTNGIPFIGLFFTGLQVYVLFEVVRVFRGSSSGI